MFGEEGVCGQFYEAFGGGYWGDFVEQEVVGEQGQDFLGV